ncbi:hypothetical protein AAG747_05060 [Rapidithrix thailandica]|uniref:TonB C-terminal domain-containing protein n=1 Tax=Rapidithrix thailandica TaxID=413964 RepID=A0AAW9S6E4_9BACT
MKLFIFVLIVFQSVRALGQNDEKVNKSLCESHLDTLTNIEVYLTAEKIPEPNGGMTNLYKMISKTLIFPRQKFERMGIEPSKIIVGFIVNEEGRIIGKRIIQNIEGTNVAVQILKIITDFEWKSGFCDNKPVPVMMILPIQVCLR